jgi:FMN-dependent oxidoreductase (nitrilotriacetate monooxygenase family)
MAPRQLKLGFILHGVGYNWGDWRHPDRPVDASTNLDFYRRQAQAAEAGKLHFLFVADSLYIDEASGPHYLSRFEPLTVLSALAMATSRIGLVGTASTTYSEPFTVARQFASLDHLSGGRAGWNVVTTMMAGAAANYGRDEHLPHAVRYRRAAEFMDVVRGLWDGWEPDAFVGDRAAGVFVDTNKLHRLDHQGEFLKVRGPLNIRRPPQGHPVIFQAGSSADGQAFAAAHADAIFAPQRDFDASQAHYRQLKAAIAAAGRDPDRTPILLSAFPVIGLDEADTEQLCETLRGFLRIEDAMALLTWRFDGVDFSGFDLDAPFPDLPPEQIDRKPSMVKLTIAEARRTGLTLRQVALRIASPSPAFIGTPDKVADALQAWVEGEAADGFVIYETLPGQLERLTQHVVPLLQARGVFHADYEGATFREEMGLDLPPNPHAM